MRNPFKKTYTMKKGVLCDAYGRPTKKEIVDDASTDNDGSSVQKNIDAAKSMFSGIGAVMQYKKKK